MPSNNNDRSVVTSRRKRRTVVSREARSDGVHGSMGRRISGVIARCGKGVKCARGDVRNRRGVMSERCSRLGGGRGRRRVRRGGECGRRGGQRGLVPAPSRSTLGRVISSGGRQLGKPL